MYRKSVGIVLWIALASISGAGQARDQMNDARDLYYAADYEEALAVLQRLESSGTSDVRMIESLRAACLLALGRTTDAEQAFERLVLIAPDLEPDQLAMPPWIVSRFAAVRERLLTRIAPQGPAPQRETSATSVPADQPDHYTIEDAAVTRPTVLSERVPEPPAAKRIDFSGTITVQVDIGTDGTVEHVSVAGDVHPIYREMIRAAAENWQYRPATLAAQPVKFRKALRIDVR